MLDAPRIDDSRPKSSMHEQRITAKMYRRKSSAV